MMEPEMPAGFSALKEGSPVRIGEFAERNGVSAKMLRHYDEIGLLKPAAIDPATGYRFYTPEQSHVLNWILILKSLDFSLGEIRELLGGPLEARDIIRRLVRKRIEISSALNVQIQKKIAIDRLIALIEKEGFDVNKTIDLKQIGMADVHDIKKNMPNMEMFLDAACGIVAECPDEKPYAVFRFDISHFKRVNDDYGFDAGDRVIVACYRIVETNVSERFPHAAVGRAHGDEFIVFVQADKPAIQEAARAIVDDVKRFDFSAAGCPRPVGCCIGGLVSFVRDRTDVRNMIEASIEVIERAKRDGPNSVLIEVVGA